ncbi:Mite group 2 allergen-like Ixo r 2 [Pseudolycoriella hygida]|uniref:Mite group 2 allergen-like Ixo r 2 n=1 Tax=Pseudolycoriella hygida TaxID=35572 RepID=A0A9Q0MXQ6_9DIPT|nr:Mite group 2 allergen-like Ixo r 2 [Pseudolycoriella hygida]
MFTYLVVAAVLPTLIMGSYPIVQCPGGLPSPIQFEIEGCDSSPCSVQRGAVIPFRATIIANENTPSLTLEIEIYAFGNANPWPVPPALANVCNHLEGRGCPVSAGEQVVHASSIPVIVDFGGGVPVTLRSRIYNASGSVMSCSVINARVY